MFTSHILSLILETKVGLEESQTSAKVFQVGSFAASFDREWTLSDLNRVFLVLRIMTAIRQH